MPLWEGRSGELWGKARADLQVDVHRGGRNRGEEAVDGRGEAGRAGGESVY